MPRSRSSPFTPSRSMIRTALLLTMLAFVLPMVVADTKTAKAPVDTSPMDKAIIEEAKAHSEVLANLTYMSDIIGSRLTGSAALKRANDWTAERMKSYGLSNVHLEGWTIPVGWERGKATMRIIEPDVSRPLTVASYAWAPGTKGKITGDVVIVKAKNKEELNAYKGKLKNAVVLRGEPARVQGVAEKQYPYGQGPNAARRDEKGDVKGAKDGKDAKQDVPPRQRPDFAAGMAFRRELTDFLRTEGVACTLIDSAKPHELLNMTGNWRSDDRVNSGEPIPSLFITHEGYAMLHRLATRPEPAKTRVEFEIQNKFVEGPIAVYNTVGEIPGSEKPDEFIVVGAHLDSWDLGQGTTDNGTGSCVVLETARILSKLGIKPKRTIRFVLFTGEEQGLHGSREYAKKHKEELPKMSVALVHDTGTGKVIGIGLQGRAVIKPILEKELTALSDLGVGGFDLGSLSGTDHQSFEAAGVPGFAMRQDPAEYRFTHHSQSDTLDKAKEPDLIQGAQVMAIAAMHIANLPDLLPRDKPAGADNGRGRRGQQPPTPPPAATPVEKK